MEVSFMVWFTCASVLMAVVILDQQAEIKSLERQHRILKTALRRKGDEFAKAKQNETSLQHVVQQLNQEIDILNKTLDEDDVRYSDEVQKLKQELTEWKNKAAGVADYQRLNKELIQKTNNTESNNTIASLENSIKYKDMQIDRLQREISSLKEDLFSEPSASATDSCSPSGSCDAW